MCGCGGIGRHARFRFLWETVQVQVLSPAPVGVVVTPFLGVYYYSVLFVLDFIDTQGVLGGFSP